MTGDFNGGIYVVLSSFHRDVREKGDSRWVFYFRNALPTGALFNNFNDAERFMQENNRKWHHSAGNIPFLIFLFVFSFFLSVSCGNSEKQNDPLAAPEAKTSKEKSPPLPVTFKTISGTWELRYPNRYGYVFKLYKNYRAVVILYLNSHSLIFKGVYTLEGSNNIRINIYEMKKCRRTAYLNLASGFVKAKSSYFIFSAERRKKRHEHLFLRPRRIIIDGNNSDGYFEPVIKLKRAGRRQ